MDFKEFPKMSRLSREVIITEKIDGTNASVTIVDAATDLDTDNVLVTNGSLRIRAGSRTKWITPGKTTDNFGFARWVQENSNELFKLGEGTHFGEWWGNGVGRGYGLPKGEKRFSLFNTYRWSDPLVRPKCCSVVPVLYSGNFDTESIDTAIETLAKIGSIASPGFMKPEGIVIFHTAANMCFKKTILNDEIPKSALPL